MSDERFFLDTNVLIYMFDDRDPAKQAKAKQLVRSAVETENGCISYQVVQEFFNALTKVGLMPSIRLDVEMLLDRYLSPLCRVHSSIPLVQRALDLHERWRYSFYDSLVIAAALQADCKLLYSEDLQHGQKIEQLTIANPFVDEP